MIRNLQIGNAFNAWNSTISHANWQCLTKKKKKKKKKKKSFFFFFFFFVFVMHITPLLEVPLKEIYKKICCQFEWWNRDLILLKINPVRGWRLHLVLVYRKCGRTRPLALVNSAPTTLGSIKLGFSCYCSIQLTKMDFGELFHVCITYLQ